MWIVILIRVDFYEGDVIIIIFDSMAKSGDENHDDNDDDCNDFTSRLMILFVILHCLYLQIAFEAPISDARLR